MNLRSLLKGLCLVLFFALISSETQAQSTQLAGINQDGLIQLGSNHPFVAQEYVIDFTHLGVSSQAGAATAFSAYVNAGFSLTFDMPTKKAYLRIPTHLIADTDMPVSVMNKQLAAMHRIHR